MADKRANVAVIHAKKEVTYGVDPTLAASDTLIVQDLEMTPFEADQIESAHKRSFFGGREQYPVNLRRSTSFGCIHGLYGGAAGTAPAIGELLQACAMLETVNASTDVVYTPVTDNPDSAYIRANFDGDQYDAPGSRGTVSFACTPNEFFRFDFEFLGLYLDPVTAAALAEDDTGWGIVLPVDPVQTATFVLHGTAYALLDMSFDQANENNKITAVGGSGSETVEFTDRAETGGQITIKAVPKDTTNWEAIARAGTTGAVQLIHGITAGSIVQFDAPVVQITDVDMGEQDGIETTVLDYRCLPNAATGNDDFSFTFL